MILDSNAQPISSEAVAVDPNLDALHTLQWLYKNTNFPTFADFSKDPDRWRQKKNEIFDSIENLNVGFRDRVAEVKYYWRGKYFCKSLAKVQECALNEGLSGAELEMEPIAEPMDGSSNLHNSRIKIKVNVWPKGEFKAQGGIVANDQSPR